MCFTSDPKKKIKLRKMSTCPLWTSVLIGVKYRGFEWALEIVEDFAPRLGDHELTLYPGMVVKGYEDFYGGLTNADKLYDHRFDTSGDLNYKRTTQVVFLTPFGLAGTGTQVYGLKFDNVVGWQSIKEGN